MEAKPEHLAKFAHIPDLHRRAMLAMMASLDENVGRVLAKHGQPPFLSIWLRMATTSSLAKAMSSGFSRRMKIPSLNCRTRRGVMAFGKSTSRKSTPVQLGADTLALEAHNDSPRSLEY
jgi:hypothetical protein